MQSNEVINFCLRELTLYRERTVTGTSVNRHKPFGEGHIFLKNHNSDQVILMY
jgi:hypothetical protein